MENPDQKSNGLTGIEVLHRILVNGHIMEILELFNPS